MTKGELAKVTMTWRWAHFGAVMFWSLQLICTSSDKTKMGEGIGHPSTKSDPMEVRKFCLNDIKGPVHTIWKVTIPPFSKVNVKANSSVKGHCMRVDLLMQLMPGPQLPAAVVPTATYGKLHPGFSRVPICLHNLSDHTGHSHKSCDWTGCPCQPSTTGSPPNQDFWRVKSQTPKGMGLGSPGPARSPRVARIRAETGQRAAAQMGAPVCMQWPGPGQNYPDQTQGRINGLDTLQGALLTYTPPHVWWHEGPYPGNAGYWCNLQVTQSMG